MSMKAYFPQQPAVLKTTAPVTYIIKLDFSMYR